MCKNAVINLSSLQILLGWRRVINRTTLHRGSKHSYFLNDPYLLYNDIFSASRLRLFYQCRVWFWASYPLKLLVSINNVEWLSLKKLQRKTPGDQIKYLLFIIFIIFRFHKTLFPFLPSQLKFVATSFVTRRMSILLVVSSTDIPPTLLRKFTWNNFRVHKSVIKTIIVQNKTTNKILIRILNA